MIIEKFRKVLYAQRVAGAAKPVRTAMLSREYLLCLCVGVGMMWVYYADIVYTFS